MPRVRKIRRRKLNRGRSLADAQVDAVLPSRFKQQPSGGASRVVIVGNLVFNLKLSKLIEGEAEFEVVATADTLKDAIAYPNEFGADLTIVDVDFGGLAEGISLTREINERSPGCAFMLICGPLTSTVVKNLWIFGTESWSVISQATAKNPKHLSEAVSSAVHGITWVEPGIQREMRDYGPRPKSLDERKLTVFEQTTEQTAEAG